MLKDETKTKKLKNEKKKTKQSLIPRLFFQIYNSWNLKSRLNEKAHFLINLMLKSKIKKI